MVLIVFAYVQQGPWQDWKTKTKKIDNFLSIIYIDMIEKREITQGTSTVSLEKNNESWKVGGTKDFYVKESTAKRLREALGEVVNGNLELVSKNENNKKEFGVDESGISVKIVQGGIDYNFIIGKVGPTASVCYIAPKDKKETYLLDTNVRTAFIKDEWRDNKIFSFVPERIKSVRFQYPTGEFISEKIENVWQGIRPNKFAVSEKKVMGVLEVMANLEASEIPEQTFSGTGLEKNSIIIEAVDSFGSYIVMIGDANSAGLYYAKKGSSDNIYLISEDDKKVFDLKIADLQ